MTSAKKIVVAGSIAYDYLMTFPGSFSDHILPDQLNRLSLSFLVDEMEKRRGGCAPNIAYTLALLGERPYLMGTAGRDFGEYRAWLEQQGIDTTYAIEIENKFTASFFCSTDQNNAQIASFYTGAMADAKNLSFRRMDFSPDWVIVSPDDPTAMVNHARECRDRDIRYIFDPGQQCARNTAEELTAGLVGADVVIVNDYEMSLITQKTGMTESALLEKSEALIITKGEKGSTVLLKDREIDVPAVPEDRIVDPTGVGDAYRGGLLKGLAVGADWETCARLGSVAATYALEHVGGQSHFYTLDEFKSRYEANFGKVTL